MLLRLNRRTCIVISLLVAGELSRAQTAPIQYTGPGSCASSSCHGGVQPRNDTSVLQNEYSTWVVQDKHTRALAVLGNDVAQRMGRILKLQPEKEPRCLACHSLDIEPSLKAATFDRNDGVSCENCH